jgi:hypothetical protein
MASHIGSDPLDEHNEPYFTSNYPSPFRTRGPVFGPSRATTLSAAPAPALQRRPPIPEVRAFTSKENLLTSRTFVLLQSRLILLTLPSSLRIFHLDTQRKIFSPDYFHSWDSCRLTLSTTTETKVIGRSMDWPLQISTPHMKHRQLSTY